MLTCSTYAMLVHISRYKGAIWGPIIGNLRSGLRIAAFIDRSGPPSAAATSIETIAIASLCWEVGHMHYPQRQAL